MHRLELRARLDGELVERQMIRRQRERLAQFGPPGFERLARPRIDQIERDAREDRPRRLQRGDRLRRRVLPSEHHSAAGSRLCTPIDTRFTPASRNAANRPASTLVGLASSVISMSSAGANRRRASVDQRGHRVRLHQAGRAAAEEDRGQPAAAEPFRLPRQFAAQRGAEARLRDALAHVRVEVAIRALGQAERPVDIERQRFHCGEI